MLLLLLLILFVDPNDGKDWDDAFGAGLQNATPLLELDGGPDITEIFPKEGWEKFDPNPLKGAPPPIPPLDPGLDIPAAPILFEGEKEA